MKDKQPTLPPEVREQFAKFGSQGGKKGSEIRWANASEDERKKGTEAATAARMKLSSKKRSEIAKKAAAARWAKKQVQ